jgi:hypothetical protein
MNRTNNGKEGRKLGREEAQGVTAIFKIFLYYCLYREGKLI